MVFPTVPGVGGNVCVDGVVFDICVEWRYVVVRGGIERYQAKRELTGRRVRGKVFNGNWAAIQTVRYYRRCGYYLNVRFHYMSYGIRPAMVYGV